MTDDKRKYQRVPFHAEISMRHEGASWKCRLDDISLKGVLVAVPDEIDPGIGDIYDLEFRLGVEVVITMRMRVVHRQEKLVGLAWSDIDIESLTHLRRLLELNMSNPDEMDGELASLR